jgi:hypothetical protein
MLIKPPFKHYLGAKHCLFCQKYIHPGDPQYTKKIYCDGICRNIAETIRKLGKLLEIKGFNDKKTQLNNIFLINNTVISS